jgi:hypothetical protein
MTALKELELAALRPDPSPRACLRAALPRPADAPEEAAQGGADTDETALGLAVIAIIASSLICRNIAAILANDEPSPHACALPLEEHKARQQKQQIEAQSDDLQPDILQQQQGQAEEAEAAEEVEEAEEAGEAEEQQKQEENEAQEIEENAPEHEQQPSLSAGWADMQVLRGAGKEQPEPPLVPALLSGADASCPPPPPQSATIPKIRISLALAGTCVSALDSQRGLGHVGDGEVREKEADTIALLCNVLEVDADRKDEQEQLAEAADEAVEGDADNGSSSADALLVGQAVPEHHSDIVSDCDQVEGSSSAPVPSRFLEPPPAASSLGGSQCSPVEAVLLAFGDMDDESQLTFEQGACCFVLSGRLQPCALPARRCASAISLGV